MRNATEANPAETYDLEAWPAMHGAPVAQGVLRSTPEDFFVEECMDDQRFGEGEHHCFFIEKREQNTAYVARRLANYAGVREMDVGYCGLKDRNAVTRQWFSIYFGKRPTWDGQNFNLEGVTILDRRKSPKKLKRGDHSANRFRLVVRGMEGDDRAQVDRRLEQIRELGFPNYFGEQRFGRDAHNLKMAAQWFSGEKRLSVRKGGMYLSAARAWLFNALLAERIAAGAMQAMEGDLSDDRGLLLCLFGDGALQETGEPQRYVQQIADRYALLSEGLRKNRIQMTHRPAICHPAHLKWIWEKDTLVLKFELPTGSFATSLLREVIEFKAHEVTAVQ